MVPGNPLTDRSSLAAGTRNLLNALSAWQRDVSVLTWDGTQGFLPIIRRSMLRRQLDSLAVALELVESNRGYAAVSLLRPACEELLWLRYFNTLPSADATSLAECLIGSRLLMDLEAQAGEVGENEMTVMGLDRALAGFRSKEPALRQRLKELGGRLDWPSRAVSAGDVPSTWFVAKATDSTKMYRFLYHATSRYVHFSAVELARRGWGHPGRLEISADTYEPVWAAFSLSWGTRLFGWTLQAALDALRAEGVAEPPHDALQQAFDMITEVALVPLVTPDEMVWSADS